MNLKQFPGGHSEREPPDPIPNSEVKTLCADGSVPCSHARVGHCQGSLKRKPPPGDRRGFFRLARSATPGVSVSALFRFSKDSGIRVIPVRG